MTVEHQTYNLELGKRIDVFDNVFPLNWRISAFNFVSKSLFQLGWSDSSIPERKPHDSYIHSKWTLEDVQRSGILDYIKEPITDLLDGLSLIRAVLNLSTPSDVNYTHTHPEKKVLLYYANLEWGEGFHGETQFWSEDLKRVQYTSLYTPGRLILFDAAIPHTIRPQSIIAPQFRFTLALIYDKKEVIQPKIPIYTGIPQQGLIRRI